ncbi:DUF4360 domain-containing protein [Dactylosporangium matsuzakiense]|uniref:DUF4360 domain-containing protein n=1 Tax=Dactylosporangium matsuzakiense TaxID=53360 RepID=A0A9W6KVF8_9ACTN|nr:DUF4360 domain-containing protein [Dactylosporangium matsuzakiense]UWZ47844.1 DUF4360 domain-containing protein [Dactylosporangium matsuzakiense]GLL08776.1 hypothetical protein GCM10017581_105490 [Dactylosporangium matsuzakiense]
MFHAVTAGAMLLSSLAAPAAPPVTPPPPNEVSISVVTANGSGCPDGSAAVDVSPDRKAFTVTYSEYMAQVGVGTKPTDFRKNCQLALDVHIPQGFTYAIADADYRGFAHLERGATGTAVAGYYFQGNSQTARASHPFRGPMDDNWQTKDSVAVTALVFEKCGEERHLNINTELRVNAGSSNKKTTTSFMSMDSTDAAFSTVYQIAWKRCP